MKIPVLEQPSVATRPQATPYSRLDTRGAFGEGIAQGIQALAPAVDAVRVAVDRTRQRADEVAVTDGLTALEHGATQAFYGSNQQGAAAERSPGFLSVRGQAAVGASGETVTSLEKLRSKIEERLTSPSQKEAFRQRSASQFEGYYRRIEGHVAQQVEVAAAASAKAREAMALDAIANDYASEDTASRASEDVRRSLRGLSLSKDDADAAVAAWDAKVAATRLNQYLAARDWKGAENLFSREKATLGNAAGPLEKQIAAVKLDGVADSLALGAVAAATEPDGRVDAAKALEKLDRVEDTAVRDEARRRVQQRAVVAERAYDEGTQALSKQAFAQYNEGGWSGVDPRLKQQLNQRNPELYHRLQGETERRFKEHKTGKGEALRELERIRREALYEFNGLPADERAAVDLNEFAQRYPGLLAAKQVIGPNVDPVGFLKPQQQRAAGIVQKGESQSSSEFVKEALATVQGVVKGKENLATFKAEVTLTFEDFVETNKRRPSQDEAEKLIADLTLKRKKPGLFGLWESEELAFQANARARREGGAVSISPARGSAAAKVEVVGPGGKRGQISADKLEGWLKSHPEWKRR